jgi:hypothetical protein
MLLISIIILLVLAGYLALPLFFLYSHGIPDQNDLNKDIVDKVIKDIRDKQNKGL